MPSTDEFVNVRYLVDDVDASVAFYTSHLGVPVRSNRAPAFADVVRGHLRLLLGFRSEVVTGPGGRQSVLDDPAGNPVELFQPAT